MGFGFRQKLDFQGSASGRGESAAGLKVEPTLNTVSQELRTWLIQGDTAGQATNLKS